MSPNHGRAHVLGEAPPDGGATVFRPPYFGTSKPLVSTDDLQASLLPSLPATASAPTLSDVAASFAPVQLDHKFEWQSDFIHPVDSGPYYGAAISTRNAEAALRLMLDDPPSDKTEALINYVQYGIDLYYIYLEGGTWPTNGGHGEGRKLPIAFAGVLLDRADMQNAVRDSGPEDFGENGGVFYSSEAGRVLWGQSDSNEDRYWENIATGGGGRCYPDPYGLIDGGQRPGGWYQFCCTSLPWKATATALQLMPSLIDVWNQQDFLDYAERWVSHGTWSQPDPCAPVVGVCEGGDNPGAACTTASEPTVCTGDSAYCDASATFDADYGVLYGPDGNGGCIPDTDPSDGTGRFPALHGMNADDGHYGSPFAGELWDAHM